MGDIHINPGMTFEGEQGKVTLQLIRMHGETQEAFVHRCQEVVNLAVSFVPLSAGTNTFNFGDTSKYRKVGEHSYEMITPGYETKETEQAPERDTHFAGSASLLWDDMHTLYLADTADKTDPEHEATKARYEQMDKQRIAHYAYDLVAHTVEHTGVQQYDPATGKASASIEEVIVRSIPDMKEWPEQQGEWPMDEHPVRIPIPHALYTRLMNAIGARAMRLVGQNPTNRVVSQREDTQALRQARAEAVQEAIEDWLAKPKDEKWR